MSEWYSDETDAVLIKAGDLRHLPDSSFNEGIHAIGSIVFGRHHLTFFHEPVDHGFAVPIGRIRMAVGNHFVGRTIEAYALPFAVQQIEIESVLVVERKSVPRITERFVDGEFAFRVHEFHKLD